MKDCRNCSYATKIGCEILKEKQVDCTSWADEVEKEKRENAIKRYIDLNPSNVPHRQSEDMVKSKLNKNYLSFYEMGYNDTEISKELKISLSSTSRYRQKLGLDTQKGGKKRACGNRQ